VVQIQAEAAALDQISLGIAAMNMCNNSALLSLL
jgi:hypothetical protein